MSLPLPLPNVTKQGGVLLGDDVMPPGVLFGSLWLSFAALSLLRPLSRPRVGASFVCWVEMMVVFIIPDALIAWCYGGRQCFCPPVLLFALSDGLLLFV